MHDGRWHPTGYDRHLLTGTHAKLRRSRGVHMAYSSNSEGGRSRRICSPTYDAQDAARKRRPVRPDGGRSSRARASLRRIGASLRERAGALSGQAIHTWGGHSRVVVSSGHASRRAPTLVISARVAAAIRVSLAAGAWRRTSSAQQAPRRRRRMQSVLRPAASQLSSPSPRMSQVLCGERASDEDGAAAQHL
eukprot:scaffold76796_cov32-Tisochrysis_lutea.AAC.2